MRLNMMGVDLVDGMKGRVIALGLVFSGALCTVGCGGSYSAAKMETSAFASADMAQAEYAEEYEDDGGGELGEVSTLESLSESAPAPMMEMQKGAPHRAKMDGEPDADQPPAKEPTPDSPQAGPRRPMLIYRAELGLAVFRVRENLDTIEQMAAKLGGYLVERGEGRIQVRVPAKDFDATVENILKLGDVHRRHITAQDVTAEFTDIQIRLKNALAVRDRLEALLADAANVDEALKVEKQLSRVAEKIEVFKGRLKLLRELTAFSTITVEFSERTEAIKSRVELPFPWLNQLGLGRLLDL